MFSPFLSLSLQNMSFTRTGRGSHLPLYPQGRALVMEHTRSWELYVELNGLELESDLVYLCFSILPGMKILSWTLTFLNGCSLFAAKHTSHPSTHLLEVLTWDFCMPTIPLLPTFLQNRHNSEPYLSSSWPTDFSLMEVLLTVSWGIKISMKFLWAHKISLNSYSVCVVYLIERIMLQTWKSLISKFNHC